MKESIDEKILTKINNYYKDNYWNIYDTILFLSFYASLMIRFSPIIGKVYLIGGENCYETARLNLIFVLFIIIR
jgi:hypothetical protein